MEIYQLSHLKFGRTEQNMKMWEVEERSLVEFVPTVLLISCGRKVKVSSQENLDSTVEEEANGSHRESKLELFGFDSLVNILGLRRYAVPFHYSSSLVLYELASVVDSIYICTQKHA